MTTDETRSAFSVTGLPRVLLSVSAFASLLLSWGVLFWFIVFETELLLPYDTSWYDYWGWPQGSPPVGSWQRSLNYFFESLVGGVLPAIFVVGVSALLLGIIFSRISQFRERPIPLLFGFAATNFLGVFVMFLVSYIVIALFGGEWTGWSGTMMAWLPTCLLLMLLFVIQIHVLPKRLVHE